MKKNKYNHRDNKFLENAKLAALCLVSLSYSVPISEIKSATRCKAQVAFARQVAMYLVNVRLGVNLNLIGKLFERDRSTAAHACRRIEEFRDDPEFDALMESLGYEFDRLMSQSYHRLKPPRLAPPQQRMMPVHVPDLNLIGR